MPRSRKRLLEITYETIREKYGGLSVPRFLLKLAAKPREWLLQKVDFRPFVGMCHLGTRQYELTVNVFLLLSSSWVALTYTFCLPAYHICRTQCTAELRQVPDLVGCFTHLSFRYMTSRYSGSGAFWTRTISGAFNMNYSSRCMSNSPGLIVCPGPLNSGEDHVHRGLH